jgi:hypothetical protein
MVDLGLALTWIAISAASAKGLSAFARATATSDTEEELAPLIAGGPSMHAGWHPIITHSHLLRDRP